MVPRVMHVAGGEEKEGEGFASREAAAWKEGRSVSEINRHEKSGKKLLQEAIGRNSTWMVPEASRLLASPGGQTPPCFLLVV